MPSVQGPRGKDPAMTPVHTTAPKSKARRSAQTALWHITHAMLRWMAPFLSFTAEEAWPIFAPGQSQSIFTQTYSDVSAWGDDALLEKWARIRAIRETVNKDIETVRAAGQLGSSLQAWIEITVNDSDAALLNSLGDDLKFVTITSQATVVRGESLSVAVKPASEKKCERCWHRRPEVNANTEYLGICGRCIDNISGKGEVREYA